RRRAHVISPSSISESSSTSADYLACDKNHDAIVQRTNLRPVSPRNVHDGGAGACLVRLARRSQRSRTILRSAIRLSVSVLDAAAAAGSRAPGLRDGAAAPREFHRSSVGSGCAAAFRAAGAERRRTSATSRRRESRRWIYRRADKRAVDDSRGPASEKELGGRAPQS